MPKFGTPSTTLAQNRQNVGKVRPMFGCCQGSTKTGPESKPFGAKSTTIGPKSANFGPALARNRPQNWPEADHVWPNCGQNWTEVGQIRHDFVRTWPNSARVQPKLARVRPDLGQTGRRNDNTPGTLIKTKPLQNATKGLSRGGCQAASRAPLKRIWMTKSALLLRTSGCQSALRCEGAANSRQNTRHEWPVRIEQAIPGVDPGESVDDPDEAAHGREH